MTESLKQGSSEYFSDGLPLYLNIDDFVELISDKKRCFICGISNSATDFNKEHIFPRWILKKYNLWDKTTVNPAGYSRRYDQYVLPCCTRCNSLMGESYEKYIQTALEQPTYIIGQRFAYDLEFQRKLFGWLACIFLKNHIKDLYFKTDIKDAAATTMLGDMYDWYELHHIHCLSRLFIDGMAIHPEALGTVLICDILPGFFEDNFYYADTYSQRSLFLVLGTTAIIAVLNDSTAAHVATRGLFRDAQGPLHALQAATIFAHYSTVNEFLEERPRYYSATNSEEGTNLICARLPKQVNVDLNFENAAHVKTHNSIWKRAFSFMEDAKFTFDGGKIGTLDDAVEAGLLDYLRDKSGNFVDPQTIDFQSSPTF